MRVCAACSGAAIDQGKGQPNHEDGRTEHRRHGTTGSGEQEIGGRAAGGRRRIWATLSRARARQGVKLNTAAKIRTARRGAITVFIGWNLSSVRFRGIGARRPCRPPGSLLQFSSRTVAPRPEKTDARTPKHCRTELVDADRRGGGHNATPCLLHRHRVVGCRDGLMFNPSRKPISESEKRPRTVGISVSGSISNTRAC